MNIYDGAFLQKQWTAKNRWLFLQKDSIVDVLLGSKYVFLFLLYKIKLYHAISITMAFNDFTM